VDPRRLRRLDRSAGPGGERVYIARSFRARLVGLVGLAGPPHGCALLIPRCSCVHTFGMRFPLDVAFLDARGEEVAVRRAVRPGRIVWHRGAAAVVERPAAQAEPTSPARR
jgi:uncharacterized membrane protein (UPF0127 family)